MKSFACMNKVTNEKVLVRRGDIGCRLGTGKSLTFIMSAVSQQLV
jgi:hypothetical protein